MSIEDRAGGADTVDQRPMARFQRAVAAISEAAGLVAGLALIGMMAVLCIEVYSRYVIGRPTYWANEVVSYLLVATTAFGAPYTLSVHGHVAIDVFVQKAPKRLRAISHRLGSVIVVVFAAVLLWYGWLEVLRSARLGEVSLTPLAVPSYLPFSLIPVCAILLILQALAALLGPVPDSESAHAAADR